VGNEQFGNWQVGHVDAETYAQRYLAFATALRAADTGLRLIAVGVPNDLYGHWNELLLTAAGHEIDALSVHYYSIRTERWAQPPSPETLYWPKVASACEVEAMLEQTLTLIERFSSPPVPLAFDEWNTFVAAVPPDFLEDYTIADALYAGGVMNACLRHANRITMSAAFNLINVMGNFRVTPTQIWETPTSLVIGLMTRLRGPLSVAVQVSSPTIATPGGGNLPAMPAVPLVDAAATYDPAGRCLYVYLVNRHPEMAAHVAVAGVVGSARLHIVSGNHPMALNTSEHPMAVHIQEAQSEGDDYLLLPPHSFTVAHFSQL
jgi:alpha-N-arabinofuranosidase